jgi:hypothetical protein
MRTSSAEINKEPEQMNISDTTDMDGYEKYIVYVKKIDKKENI